MSLAVSASGSTVYMEPEPVVALNNAQALLRAQEQEEEESILAELSQMVKKSTVSLQRMIKAVTALDIATARAQHATWLSGERPVFISPAEASQVCCFSNNRCRSLLVRIRSQLHMYNCNQSFLCWSVLRRSVPVSRMRSVSSTEEAAIRISLMS